MTSIAQGPGRGAAFIDLVLIIVVLIGVKETLLCVDAVWTYAGPISLLSALAVALWRLRRSGQGLRDIGMKEPKSILRLAMWTAIIFVVSFVFGNVAQYAAVELLGAPSEAAQEIDARYQGRFDNVAGNLPVYLFWLTTAWIIGGFTEELLFRGALFNRFERVLAGVPFAAILAIALQAVLFGQQHFYYQGAAGWAATGASAFVFGVFYLMMNRNIWPLILAHGLNNTLGLTLIYLGLLEL